MIFWLLTLGMKEFWLRTSLMDIFLSDIFWDWQYLYPNTITIQNQHSLFPNGKSSNLLFQSGAKRNCIFFVKVNFPVKAGLLWKLFYRRDEILWMKRSFRKSKSTVGDSFCFWHPQLHIMITAEWMYYKSY